MSQEQRFTPRLRKPLCHVLLSLAAVAPALMPVLATAQTFNLNALVTERMRTAGKMATAFKDATGKDLPANASVQLEFAGTTSGKITYTTNANPTPIPEVLDMQRMDNCNETVLTSQVTLAKERANTFSLSNTNAVESSVSVSVSVEAPFASASSEYRQSWSASTTTEQSKSDLVKWQGQSTVTVNPGKAVLAQLVIDTQPVSGTYRVPLLMTGKVNGKAVSELGGYEWSWVSDARVPGNAASAGRESGQILQICMISDQRRTIGKVWKGKCEVNDRLSPLTFGHVVYSKYQVLVGDGPSMRWLTPAEAAASGKQPFQPLPMNKSFICLALDGDSRVPGEVVGDRCMYTTGDKPRETTQYLVLMPRSTEQPFSFNLDRYLGEADRTVDIKGTFRGSAGTRSYIRVSRAVELKPAECITDESGSSLGSGPTTKSVTGAKAIPALRIKKLPVTNSTPVIGD